VINYDTPLAMDGETIYGVVMTILGGMHYRVRCMNESTERMAHVCGSFSRKQRQQSADGDKKKSESNRLVVGSIVLISIREFNTSGKGVSCDIIHAYSKKEIQHLINENALDETLFLDDIYRGPEQEEESSSSEDDESSSDEDILDIDDI
jgi:translation initiation factor IF-1